jgi:hypothetical protein
MNHYWTSDDPIAMRQAQIEDWIDDLIEFPLHAIEEAIREWRQTQTRRPTPAQIRSLAVAAQRASRPLPRSREPVNSVEQQADRTEYHASLKWRYRVAAAYRWMHDRGTTMPSGIDDRAPIVNELVECFEAGRELPTDFISRLPAPRWPPGFKPGTGMLPRVSVPRDDGHGMKQVQDALGIRATEHVVDREAAE